MYDVYVNQNKIAERVTRQRAESYVRSCPNAWMVETPRTTKRESEDFWESEGAERLRMESKRAVESALIAGACLVGGLTVLLIALFI